MPSERKDLEKAAIMMRSIKNPVNKVAQDVVKAVKGVTKVKVANSFRSAFAPNTTVEYSGTKTDKYSKIHGYEIVGATKTVRKLDKNDGTVIKFKEIKKVSKNKKNWEGREQPGVRSVNKSVRSRYADDGVEGFRNKRTKYKYW